MIIKCKMCGGEIEFEQGATVGVCDSCGTKQTLPRLDDDRKANLYDRANHFRRNNDFDKAMGIYEQILNEDGTDAETYWSLVLCRYGIEYVEDPATHKHVPTVNRAQYTSIFDDDDYKSALKYADAYQRSIYEEEAKAINEIQKGILEISQKEEPFDVFICYKETDNSGRRTPDSVLANDLYHQLTQEGFKVFFSGITLEDKLGTAYEPYIFAALNSAKVMVVIGTKPEYFNAVWVKNEWSRYLALVKKSGGKKVLIPAYRDMDPYDLPEEFSHLLAQDMSKLGFMQDLIRGIKKIASVDEPKAAVKETVVVNSGSSSVEPLLKRAFMFLEDREWEEADKYCEKVLDQDPENARAYLGKLMAECKVRRKEDLKDCREPFDDSSNFEKVVRFGDKRLVDELEGYSDYIFERNERNREIAKQQAEYDRIERVYQNACNLMGKNQPDMYLKAVKLFESVADYKDSAIKRTECIERAESTRKDIIYDEAKSLMDKEEIASYESAIEKLETIAGWRNTSELIAQCKHGIDKINIKKEQERLDAILKAKAKKKKTIIVLSSITAIVMVLMIMFSAVSINMQNDMRETLSGKTIGGTYSYHGKYRKTITIYFLNENYCHVTIDSEYGIFEHDNLPYEITGGVFGLKFNWGDENISGSVEPFEIDSSGASIEMYTPNYNSDTSMRMSEK
jgi:tetratricopeptide (TPR) repeat protein